VMIAGKTCFVAGYGHVGKGCVQSLKAAGARVLVGEVDPICALQACMEGYQVVRLDDVIEEVDIIITATGNCKIVTVEHMARMKNNAILGNIGHFDTEIDMAGLLSYKGIKRETIRPQTDRFVFPKTGRGIIILAEGRLLNLGCANGHPSFVMSMSFTNQVVAQIELWNDHKASKDKKKYTNNVYVLPKILDEKVARLHLAKLNAKLTVLTDDQAKYLHVDVNGPYKPITYRY